MLPDGVTAFGMMKVPASQSVTGSAIYGLYFAAMGKDKRGRNISKPLVEENKLFVGLTASEDCYEHLKGRGHGK
jgi:hypothetical protein